MNTYEEENEPKITKSREAFIYTDFEGNEVCVPDRSFQGMEGVQVVKGGGEKE